MGMAWRLFPGSWMDALIMIHGKLIALLVCFQPDAGSGGGMTDSLSAYGAAFVLYIVRPFYYEYTSSPSSESAWISSFIVIDNSSPVPPAFCRSLEPPVDPVRPSSLSLILQVRRVSTVNILLSMFGISTSMGVSINARHGPSTPLIVYSLVAEHRSM
ncbi:predicted protein [Aspergillus nidulans FGSC A4]|uniref:Uncharacterized protein n=1 Tax=Emericella nidulans (strain FGSC A4 / ATCC 38163 / CBS 112.46 / NRRL 194 / M139) TaxID=227321 RepID=Q5B6W7_EMENI|nr:hypothetical protein [Aspergillus nidulans FGSC A4]EAA59921.1 predicted protein [Aspergillus nidulans FGSC A4]CBF75553.1 TPA: conserved hypothetical protein [Aspergillus nidulans FGSC A4]|eukprot:XP_661317.1 predicted protein [Aspergillus nidulans FGSC A4]